MIRFRRLLCCSLPALLTGCISPWAVMSGGTPSWEAAVLPPGTEIVEVSVAGETLRGVYVPGEPGAPLVLHLLEAMGSATLGCLPEVFGSASCGHPVLWQLQGLGYASLMLDYRGVGASSGSRHVDHLVPDSMAMWEAAMARVERDPQRIILRTNSLGTVGACHLLEAGARPACWVAIAPIDPRTVADNLLYGSLWSPIAWLATVLATTVADFDPCRALAIGDIPKLCFVPAAGDQFVRDDELDRIRDAIEAGGGAWATLNQNHIDCAGAGHWLLPLERRLLRSLHGALAPTTEREQRMAGGEHPLSRRSAARLRLLASANECDPDLALAAAECHLPPSSMMRWVPWLDRFRSLNGWQHTRERWLDILTLRDDDGPLCSDVVVSASPWLLGLETQGRDLPTDTMASLMQKGRLKDVHELIYDERAVPFLTVNMLLGLVAGSDAPGDWASARGDRLRLLVRRALVRPGAEEGVQHSWWGIPSPNRLRHHIRKLIARSVEPNPLVGLDPGLLTEVLLSDLPEDAPHLSAFVGEHAAAVSQLLADRPWYCDMATFAASWWHAAGAVYDFGIPESWVSEHCDRVQAMPTDVQTVLCGQLQHAGKSERGEAEPMAPSCLEDLHEVDVEAETIQLSPSQLHDLACRAVPWRRVDGSPHLQFWLCGSWVQIDSLCTF